MSNPVTITVPEGVPFIDISREFDAPVAAVFRAHRDPDLIKQWLGPKGYDMKVDRYEFETGGGYRYVHISPDGESYSFNGVFHVVRENDLVIQTFEYEGYPDVVSIETMKFVDLGNGRTRLEGHSVYPTQEGRDGMAESGMEQGVTEGYEKLDAVLAGL